MTKKIGGFDVDVWFIYQRMLSNRYAPYEEGSNIASIECLCEQHHQRERLNFEKSGFWKKSESETEETLTKPLPAEAGRFGSRLEAGKLL